MSAVQDRNTLKGFFKKFAYPTQEHFEMLIDSLMHKNDKMPVSQVEGLDKILNDKASAQTLQNLINRIERGGLGGAGDIADGIVTKNKLDSALVSELEIIRESAALAESLYVNDEIVLTRGAFSGEEGDIYTGTNYCAISKPILANGETITVCSEYVISRTAIYSVSSGAVELADFYEVNDSVLNMAEVAGAEDCYYIIEVRRVDNKPIGANEYHNIIKSFVRKPITWGAGYNMNNIAYAGNYRISGTREANAQDGLPIYNGGNIEAKLEVLVNSSTVVQKLTLLNVGGGDGNVYTRVRQNGAWKPWGKLQTNIEIGRVEGSNPFDNFTDNGMYSGVYAYDSTAETFVLVVINAYLYGGGVAQLKYSTLLDGTTTVKLRTKVNGAWGEWTGLPGDGLLVPSDWFGKLNTLPNGVFEFYGNCDGSDADADGIWNWADGYRRSLGDPVYLKLIVRRGSPALAQVVGTGGSGNSLVDINTEKII